MTDVVLVLTTADSAELAAQIAAVLVDERLAACVNVSAAMESTFRWEGAIEQATERQLVIKTTQAQVGAVQKRIAELHSYELPEFLVIPVAAGSPGYLDWVRSSTGAPGSGGTRSPSAESK
jgi:periplasmic divalent cation tolerance protein